jgi:septal ring factor EnvC (AmiA/AmiB activator)
MKTSIQNKLLSAAFVLVCPLMVGCSAFSGSSMSNNPEVAAQQRRVADLERELREAERYEAEAEQRTKAAKNRLKAAEHELKALETQVERQNAN